MKLFFGIVGVAAISYVVARMVVRSERRAPAPAPTSWALGDPRLRGYVGAPFSQN